MKRACTACVLVFSVTAPDWLDMMHWAGFMSAHCMLAPGMACVTGARLRLHVGAAFAKCRTSLDAHVSLNP